MAYKIYEIEGIGPANAEKLIVYGINSTDELLDACATAKGRTEVATATGLSSTQLLKWANMADLMRISGVSEEFSALLEAAGVDTVAELRHRNADNLAGQKQELNKVRKFTRQVPTAGQVAEWVEQAASLEPKISH